ncbi:hypothetical protein NPIL_115891 [Nephila pilipes]|uniref:Uncharacterized protein n=1 Tax=Nephila pilipes TaxID=299642 RepID=A0A8X6IC03_NEPPI|nr:hypothetical protein NPIL_115891 [Nephila pilipes]
MKALERSFHADLWRKRMYHENDISVVFLGDSCAMYNHDTEIKQDDGPDFSKSLHRCCFFKSRMLEATNVTTDTMLILTSSASSLQLQVSITKALTWLMTMSFLNVGGLTELASLSTLEQPSLKRLYYSFICVPLL